MTTKDANVSTMGTGEYLFLLVVFVLVSAVLIGLVAIGAVQIGDAMGSRKIADGIQLIGTALLIPMMALFCSALFSRK